MSVIALFDKSFLQSVSVDESVWFDHFFLPVVCPIFYLETLADLAKDHGADRSPEKGVSIIAQKFPEKSGSPCTSHWELAIQSLLGNEIPMDGRIPRPGGRYVQGGNRKGVLFDRAEEDEAFARWQQGEFQDVERMYAAQWRDDLRAIDLREIPKTLQNMGFDPKQCRTLEFAKSTALEFVSGSNMAFERLRSAVVFFGIQQSHHTNIIQRWKAAGELPLSRFAPYAAYVLEVEVFFHAALGANLISTERNSNRTDIAYLFYLPFCQVFVSGDKLHRNTAPLFMRSDQEFVWGHDLKADLKKLNGHFLGLPEEEREQGIMRFADAPPKEIGSLVTDLWRRHLRHGVLDEPNMTDRMTEEGRKKLAAELMAFTKGQNIPAHALGEADFGSETLSIERRVHKRKGSWWQLPKDLLETPTE